MNIDTANPYAIQMGFRLSQRDVPDALLPTDNDLGIPLLDSRFQAGFLYLPFTRWGEIARSRMMPGTYHFYTDDYKYEALWKDPSNVINSRCRAIVEPNFSINDQMPVAVALWQIYCKRWLARYWQSYGVEIFVDLNVPPTYAELNLYGVPRGWRAYCTRGLNMDEDIVVRDYEIALSHTGGKPLFVVYGGGKPIYSLCKNNGWLWLPENIQVKGGRRWVLEAVEEVEVLLRQEEQSAALEARSK